MGEAVNILLVQLLQMALYSGTGILLYRRGLITQKGSAALSNLLLYVVLPCVIVKSFLKERTAENVRAVTVSCLLGVAVLLVAMAVSFLLFRRRPMDWFSASFSNAGFMGVPLVTGVLGGEYVFCIAGMVAVLNALQWTLGQAVLSGDKSCVSLKAVLKSPLVISFAAGLLVFGLGLPLPGALSSVLSGLAACNTPLAMIVLGVFLGQVQLRDLVTDAKAYQCSAVRLLAVPAATLLILKLLPAEYTAMGMALMLAASAPVGTNVAIYAQKLDLDYRYAARTVCLSTLLSVVTMPVMYLLAIRFL